MDRNKAKFANEFSMMLFFSRTSVFSHVLLLLLLIPQVAITEEMTQQQNAQKLLVEMIGAMKSLKYQGTLVFYRNGQFDAMKYFHSVENGEEQERLIALNSPIREVIRQSDKLICIFPNKGQIIVDHRPGQRSFLVDFPDDLTGLDRFYDFEMLQLEKIAMMDAQVVAIQPKDNYRYARKIWVSLEKKLPLKYELLNSDGRAIEHAVFIELNVDNTLPVRVLSEFDNPKMKIRHVHQMEDISLLESSFVLQNRPAGFDKVFFTRMKMHNSETFVEHLQLSDGLASVSVYFEKASESSGPMGFKAIGSINSYARKIGDYVATVVGLVPAETVQFIAQGIDLRESEH